MRKRQLMLINLYNLKQILVGYKKQFNNQQ